MPTMLDRVKVALRLTTAVYDDELTDLISAAELDLGVAGVIVPTALDALVRRAVITYCKVHFSGSADDDYDRLKKSYDEQKAQLATCTGYTDWAVT